MSSKNKVVKNNHSILKFIVKKTNENNSKKSNNNIFDLVKNKINEKAVVQETASNKEPPVSEAIEKLENDLRNEREKNEKLQKDLSASVSLLKDASSINMQKDICIKNLSKTKTTPNDSEKPNNLFDEFKGHFDLTQLKQLRSVPSGKSRGSSFVLAVMRFLYPNPSVLSQKSVTGKARNKTAKEKMTPHKKTIITEMLKQRLENGVDDFSIFQRMEKVNRLIRNAMEKMVAKKSQTELSTKKIERNENTATVNTTEIEPWNNQNTVHFNLNFGTFLLICH